MTYLHLSKQQLEDITEALEDSSLQAQQRNKLLALRMHHEGAAHGFIGRILNITQPTLRAYLAGYQEGGLPAVLEDRSYRPLSSLAPFWNCLRCSFAAAPVPNAKAAVARIEALTGLRLSESQCRARAGKAATNLSALRKLAMNLLRAVPPPVRKPASVSMRRRRYIATINPNYLAALLAHFAS
ncbi:MAG: hypothetical protein JNM65_08820 [Verrucomicrobiaceae bacterium]|nr:hypothetical protein [Verrucomicrobiaceae bacterium]